MCIKNSRKELLKLREKAEDGPIDGYKVIRVLSNMPCRSSIFFKGRNMKPYKVGWNKSDSKRKIAYKDNAFTSRGTYFYLQEWQAHSHVRGRRRDFKAVKVFVDPKHLLACDGTVGVARGVTIKSLRARKDPHRGVSTKR